MVNLRSQAYRRIDLTQLPFIALCERAKEIRIGDGRDYYRYLCTLFPGAARARACTGEKASCEDESVAKIFYLVKLLDTTQSKYYAFHALIRVAATVFNENHGRASQVSDNTAAIANRRVLDMVKQRFTLTLAGSPPSFSYYDFAAAYRKLWSTWQESCLREESEYGLAKERVACWHQQNRQLIEFVHKRAYNEIRGNVMLTVGARLPVEMTETTFDLVLDVEEVPKHAIMLETDEVEIEVPAEVQKFHGGPALRMITVVRLLWKFCACERKYIKCRGGY